MAVMTIPTIVTSFRLCLVPVIMVGMLIQEENTWWTECLFIFAAGTDWLDGYLARKLNQESELGRFLDPLVDKLLVLGPLLTFIEMKVIDHVPSEVADWAADEFIDYFKHFTTIEDYLRHVKREVLQKPTTLMSMKDEFLNEDIHYLY